ncbi:Thioredoxin-like fold containing protein [Trema orientale]|uniref:Thioredoxin-like protein Clot n=1 Tax=Trema orientale TaxID=63057 RepID=A0A2P5EL62_TREOI|nr:Thioredoxin-like fold containing protein [Trema orientale]
MPLTSLDATVSNFEGVFEKFRSEASKNKANLILFLADKDPSTSLSWCPDCVRAEPVIYKKLEATSEDVALLRAYVGDRPTWRNPQHPWRVDPKFKLTGVPTLIRWENDTISGRLEDYEAHLENKIDALVAGKCTK